ncbi:hypothetical protein LLG95_09085 [bacterium]|nr:hypothetical protein [bacterium]
MLFIATAWCAAVRAAAADPTPAPTASDAPTTPTTEFFIEVEPGNYFIGTEIKLHLQPVDPKFDLRRISAVTSKPDPQKWEQVLGWRLDYSRAKANGGTRWSAALKPFETGSVMLPDAIVTWQPKAGGEPITRRVQGPIISVQSKLLPGAPNNQLTPLREPIAIARDWSWIYGALAAVLLAALAGWLGWRWWKRRGRPAGPPEPDLPPGLWALHEIDRRSRLPVCQSGPAKAIFTLVSEVVRLYLERRYGISAIDMTTMECMRALQQRDPGDDVIRWVQDFLDECDTVKFTKIDPAPERWGTIWNDARLIVQMTTPQTELTGTPEGAAQAQEAAS